MKTYWNSMTTCKTCGAEIAKSAKVCPKCGAKQRRNSRIFLFLAILIILFGLFTPFSNNSEPKLKNEENNTKELVENTEILEEENNTKELTESAETSIEEKTQFTVGDTVELNNISVQLVSVKENKGSKFNEPTDGNVFVLCEFIIENNSSNELAVSSLGSFEAYADGYATNFSLKALIEKGNKNQLDGTIAPEKKFNGVVGYEIPKDWNEFEIRFSPNIWSRKNITFVVNK